jgi:hypothetical protein
VQETAEEYKLAVLCLQYLILECFDPDLSTERTKEFLLEGYYAFQDYAVLHWIDHLESLIPFLPLGKDSHVLGAALKDFHEVYGATEAGVEDISKEIRERCSRIQDTVYYEHLALLLGHTRMIRTSDEQMTALGDLGKVVSNNRAILEDLHSTNTLASEAKEKLKQFYGPKWNKCPRHACFYFHEGFSDATRRDNHLSRHEKPFCCTETSCPRIHFGYSTEKELKKHMATTHPDPAAFTWRFPKIKQPARKYTCTECDPPKEYTRAHNLMIHKRLHSNERPFICRFCSKSFVRKHDRERHEDKLHPNKKIQETGSSQETIPNPEEAAQGPAAREDQVSMSRADTLVEMETDILLAT